MNTQYLSGEKYEDICTLSSMHADDLERPVADADRLADRLLRAEQLARDFVAEEHDAAPLGDIFVGQPAALARAGRSLRIEP